MRCVGSIEIRIEKLKVWCTAQISENPGPIGVFESACDRDKKNVLKCITDTLYYVGTLLLTFYA